MAKAPAATAAAPPEDEAEDAAAAPENAGGEQEGAADEGPEESDVLVTIAKGPDGTYLVYEGDEPEEDEEEGEGEAGEADEGEEGNEPEGPEPIHADSVGAALKAAMDILHKDEAGGKSEHDQFTEGYNEDQSPTQKY